MVDLSLSDILVFATDTNDSNVQDYETVSLMLIESVSYLPSA